MTFCKALRKVLIPVLLALVLALACGGTAWADTFDLGATATPPVSGWDATATFSASSGTWSLDFIFTNSTANTVDINSWALQLFNARAGESFSQTGATISFAGSTVLQGWNFFADTKPNNGSTPDCNSTSTGGWLCAQPKCYSSRLNRERHWNFFFQELTRGRVP